MWQRKQNTYRVRIGDLWPKARARQEWNDRRNHVIDLMVDSDDAVLEEALWGPYRHAEQVRRALEEPQPAGLPAQAVRRRRLAERLLAEMAFPPYGRPGLGNDFVAATAIPTTLDDAPGAREALAEAATTARTQPGEMRIPNERGARGMWVRVHGPTASVVFSFLPAGRSVFVCVDDLPDNCWQIGGDTAESRQLINELYDAVVLGWKVSAATGTSA
jgi:hypothetical protein